MKNRMTVHLEEKPIYDIVLEDSFEQLPMELAKFQLMKRKVCIVTDSNVASIYLETVANLIAPICASVVTFQFKAGEENKNLNTVKDLYSTLIEYKLDRNDFLVALGGGVVGDLCGFAAATYLRGISFIQVPTTLLSQVDSSIGGKTGVDFDSYKNMVGAFYMPKLVYINVSTLLSLPDNQFFAGMGEVLKHGLIKDSAFYNWLITHKEEISNRNLIICKEMVASNCQIKRMVVEQDPKELGDRALLNFGHTLGHGIEKTMNFKLLHGECVAIGSLAALYLSAKRNKVAFDEVNKFKQLLKDYNLPISIRGIDRKEVIEATKHDKKIEAGVIKFILLDRIGNAYVDKTITEDELIDAITFITI